MPRRLAALALLSVFLALPTGCGALAAWLPAVIAAVTETGAVLDAIDARARPVVAGGDAELAERYARVMSAARAAQAAALRAAKAGAAVDRGDLTAAWEELRAAYGAVLELLGPLGVVAPSQDGSLSAGADGPLVVPGPAALRLPEE